MRLRFKDIYKTILAATIFATTALGLPINASAAQPGTVTIRISAVGDCTLGNDEKQAGIGNCFNNVYAQNGTDYFLSGAKPYFAMDDFTIANLEGTLTDLGEARTDKDWRFRGKPEYTDILTHASVEGVAFSNNHCRDYGPESYTDTISNVTKAGLLCASEEMIGYRNIKGINVAFIAITSAFRASDAPKDREYADTQYIKKIIRNTVDSAKASGAQLVVMNLHFGIEREKNPSSQQKELAHYAVDCGADVVLGHHPHVLQPVEYYNGAYIAYSLGNFCFGGNTKPKNKDTIIWQQEFTFTGGVKTGQRVQVIPFLISSDPNLNNYCPVPATGNDYTRIIGKISNYSGKYGVAVGTDGVLTVK